MEILEKIIHPRERDKLKELNPYTTLPIEHKKVKTKIINKRKYKKPKKFLNRNETKQMGLYCLPREELKYKDYVALNQLWNSYMDDLLGAKVKKGIISVDDPQFDSISSQFHKADFHGAKVKVVRSKCPSLVGIKGIVVLDTKNTFKILGKDDVLRTVPKMDSVFEMKWNKFSFTIFGKHIAIRPGEKNTKKVKAARDMDL